MGGGDLNLKKSWHPLTYRNLEKVWKREKRAEDERKKTEQLKKELEEERAMQELHALQQATGKGRKTDDRLEWMYSAGPAGGPMSAVEEKEEYLLGKKRLDKLIEQGKTAEELSAKEHFSASNTAAIYGSTANTWRDTQSKIREDPLLAIKRREQMSLKAVLSNPLQLKKIKEMKKKAAAANSSSDTSAGKRSKKDSNVESDDDDDDDHNQSDGKDKHKKKKKKESKEKNKSRSKSASAESLRSSPAHSHPKNKIGGYNDDIHAEKEEVEEPYYGSKMDRLPERKRLPSRSSNNKHNQSDYHQNAYENVISRVDYEDDKNKRRTNTISWSRSRERDRNECHHRRTTHQDGRSYEDRRDSSFSRIPLTRYSEKRNSRRSSRSSSRESRHHDDHYRISRSYNHDVYDDSHRSSRHDIRYGKYDNDYDGLNSSAKRRRRDDEESRDRDDRRHEHHYYSDRRHHYRHDREHHNESRSKEQHSNQRKINPERNYSRGQEHQKLLKGEQERKKQEEREAKLKAMMSNAEELEKERTDRLIKNKEIEEQIKKQEIEERAKRLKESGGSMGDKFLRDLHREVITHQSNSAADMISRNRAYAQKGGEFL